MSIKEFLLGMPYSRMQQVQAGVLVYAFPLSEKINVYGL